MSKKIACSVSECVHNKQKLCDLTRLNVAGSHADQVSETYCASFNAGNTHPASMNAVSAQNCNCIDCDVVNCQYNENKMCSLNEIKVDYEPGYNHCSTALNTCCDSFRS